MTQTANMCKELITQGLENLVQKEFREQNRTLISSTMQIRNFLDKMCVLDPVATTVMGQDIFRLTYILIRNKERLNVERSLDLTKLKKYKTEIFLDTRGYYNILVDDEIMSYKIHTCPPPLNNIVHSMWVSAYGDKRYRRRMFNKFLKTIQKELLM